jgi:hypothetical protein
LPDKGKIMTGTWRHGAGPATQHRGRTGSGDAVAVRL